MFLHVGYVCLRNREKGGCAKVFLQNPVTRPRRQQNLKDMEQILAKERSKNHLPPECHMTCHAHMALLCSGSMDGVDSAVSTCHKLNEHLVGSWGCCVPNLGTPKGAVYQQTGCKETGTQNHDISRLTATIWHCLRAPHTWAE